MRYTVIVSDLLDQYRPAALVVLAGHLHRVGEALEADLVEPGLGEAQGLVGMTEAELIHSVDVMLGSQRREIAQPDFLHCTESMQQDHG